MRKVALLLVLALLPVRADFKTGLKAYEQGDFATALKEWLPLAEKGDAHAQYNVALIYARGQGVPQDYKQAAEWYRKAAEQGVAAAQYNLGVMYSNGQGVPQDPQEARKWFLKAAEQGVALAQTSLGNIYESGAFKNYDEALKAYRKAAEEGIASAQFNLAIMYDLGQGVPRNYEEAAKWYRKAAEQGYPPALRNLGILYYNAQGVQRDLVEAYAWLARAEKAGDERAGELLRITAGKMKPDQIRRGQELAANWQPPKPAAQEADRTLEARLFKEPTAKGPAPKEPTAAPVAAVSSPSLPSSPAVFSRVERIVAVGDVHGDYEQFVAVLQSAGLMDGNANWIGGKAHLVQTGDILDRGPDSRRVMDLLMKLEKQAGEAGGAVHALIGNHEAMNVYGDLRYVSPAEFAAFREIDPKSTTEFSYSQQRLPPDAAARPEADRTHWEADRPPGFAEHRAALGPSGPYGRWIIGHNTAVKIDGTLFVHAGISRKYATWSVDRINQEVRAELQDFHRLHGGVVIDEEGPLWYRGLAKGDEKQLEPVVDAILNNFGVKRIVIGHTYAEAAITPRFHGKVILIDVGLSRIYDNIGKIGCLVIENGNAYALHRGQALALPADDGLDLLRYLRQAAALDPKPSPLLARLTALEQRLSTNPR